MTDREQQAFLVLLQRIVTQQQQVIKVLQEENELLNTEVRIRRQNWWMMKKCERCDETFAGFGLHCSACREYSE